MALTGRSGSPPPCAFTAQAALAGLGAPCASRVPSGPYLRMLWPVSPYEVAQIGVVLALNETCQTGVPLVTMPARVALAGFTVAAPSAPDSSVPPDLSRSTRNRPFTLQDPRGIKPRGQGIPDLRLPGYPGAPPPNGLYMDSANSHPPEGAPARWSPNRTCGFPSHPALQVRSRNTVVSGRWLVVRQRMASPLLRPLGAGVRSTKIGDSLPVTSYLIARMSGVVTRSMSRWISSYSLSQSFQRAGRCGQRLAAWSGGRWSPARNVRYGKRGD